MQIFVLFIYILWRKEFCKDKKMEIYDIKEEITKDKLEEIIKDGQIMKINIGHYEELEQFKKEEEQGIYSMFDMNVIENGKDDDNDVVISLIQKDVNELLERNPSYISMYNQKYLEETGQIDKLLAIEGKIKPYMKFNAKYDYIVGSQGSEKVLSKQLLNRVYVHVLSGQIELKLIPSKYEGKFNMSLNMYDEEVSKKGVWSDEEVQGYKSMRVELKEGETLLIPRDWLYSARLLKDSKYIELKYETIIGSIGQLNNIIYNYMQKQNIQFNKYNTIKSL